MKIITKDNFNRDLFTEKVIAKDVNKHYGTILVKMLNEKYWNEQSDHYYALVEDNYELYDGYAELL